MKNENGDVIALLALDDEKSIQQLSPDADLASKMTNGELSGFYAKLSEVCINLVNELNRSKQAALNLQGIQICNKKYLCRSEST